MVANSSHLVGIGLYTPEEAAKYARVSKRTTNRWVFGDRDGDAVIRPQLSDLGETEKLVTFLDFIQIMAVRSVRLLEKKFPLQKIRAACEQAEREFGLRFPLAAKDHRILLFGPRENLALCEMVVDFGEDERGDHKYLQVSGKAKGNFFITTVAEPFVHGIEFGDGKFAERYIAFKKGEREVVMDPHYRLGEPYLPWCGYTAAGIWDAYVSEGGIDAAAESFAISPDDVSFVVEYYDFLAGTDAT